MDGMGGQHGVGADTDAFVDPPPQVRFDERRMHVRAYNHWASLLGDRPLPRIEDLNPAEIEDFGSHSVLLDFTSGVDDPAIAFLGSALMAECGVDDQPRSIGHVPPRTLLSRLTDHYLQIIANRAPIGFEAEFTNQRGADILYRGILMPFSSDGETIDFVYGVINWKEMATALLTHDIHREIAAFGRASLALAAMPAWADGPSGAGSDMREVDGATGNTADDDAERSEGDAGGNMHDLLALARTAAADAIGAERRTRVALYRAIDLAYGVALAADAHPADYAEMLDDAGISLHPHSPTTALVKLVFGADYDKTRLSEFAAAIERARTEAVAPGTLADLLTGTAGGLKAYIKGARAARRGDAAARKDPVAKARWRLIAAEPVAVQGVVADSDGIAVVVMRRTADGGFAAIGGLSGDDRRAAAILRAVAATI